jgi:hypothetical protein
MYIERLHAEPRMRDTPINLRARAVPLDQLFFELDATRFRGFVAQLNVPAAADGGLRDLLDLTPPWKPAGRRPSSKH